MNHTIRQIEYDLLRKAVYEIVEVFTRGHGPYVVIGVGVAIIAAVFIFRKFNGNRN